MSTPHRPHPVPWIADGVYVRDRTGIAVATVLAGGSAERIAACVTACEGIPIGELRAGILQDLLSCCEPVATGRMRAILDRMKGFSQRQ